MKFSENSIEESFSSNKFEESKSEEESNYELENDFSSEINESENNNSENNDSEKEKVEEIDNDDINIIDKTMIYNDKEYKLDLNEINFEGVINKIWDLNFNIDDSNKNYINIEEVKNYSQNILYSYNIYTLKIKINDIEIISFKRFKQMHQYHNFLLSRFPYHVLPKFPNKLFLKKLNLAKFNDILFRNKSIIDYFNILLSNKTIYYLINISEFFEKSFELDLNIKKKYDYYDIVLNNFSNELKLLNNSNKLFKINIFEKKKIFEEIIFENDFEIRSLQSELFILKDNLNIFLNNLKSFYNNQNKKYNMYNNFDNIYNIIEDNILKDYNKTIDETKQIIENKKKKISESIKKLNEFYIYKLCYIYENIKSIINQINNNLKFKKDFIKIYNDFNNENIQDVWNSFKIKIELEDKIFIQEINNFIRISEENLKKLIEQIKLNYLINF